MVCECLNKHYKTIMVVIGIICFILFSAFLFLFLVTNFSKEIIAVLKWIDSIGIWGHVMLGSLIVVTSFPILPCYGMLLATCGFLYYWWGLPTVIISANIGSWFVFLTLRLGDCKILSRHVYENQSLARIMKAIEVHKVKLIIMLRLSPLPFNVLNVVFGITKGIEFKIYAPVNFVGLSFEHITSVYFGTMLRDLTDIFDGGENNNQNPSTNMRVILSVVQSVILTIVIIVVTYTVKNSIDATLEETEFIEQQKQNSNANLYNSNNSNNSNDCDVHINIYNDDNEKQNRNSNHNQQQQFATEVTNIVNKK
eukprot:TRINITY_DN1767_c5_g1_i1.p1 TRINITY_DN1767_c5_g1~~TRINITY_DN1767_c5_g1_i1.p1  ORF type:complete len:310 (+),score=100.31 TRINITY_DN1767_c5_g1_i1:41-970(+)